MKHKLKWYKLDTSAKIYPAIESQHNPALFRVSMSLKEDIEPDILLKALNAIKTRFPYYNVHMKRGLFWNYLEQNNNELRVWKDAQSPCERIYPAFNNGYLYKVKYYRNKIALDIFHVLTDGYGAMEFLKCLVNQYLIELGCIDETGDGIIKIDESPDEDEIKDGFIELLESHKDILPEEKKRSLFTKKQSFKIKDRHAAPGKYKVVTGVVSIDDMKKLSKEHNATITQILVALYMLSLMDIQNRQEKLRTKHKNIAIQVPVNVRNYYKTKCMRNFSLFVTPDINPNKTKELDDILITIKEFMSEHLTLEHLLTMAEDNSSIAVNPLIKYTPVELKNIVIRFISNTQGSNQFSGTISNLGLIKLPDNMKEHVKDVEFTLGAAIHNKSSCGVSGYNGKLYITFGRSIQKPDVIKGVFKRLVEMGVSVQLRSNY